MSEEKSEEAFWKGMAIKHWVFIFILVVACIGALIGGGALLLSYIPASEIGGNGSWTLDEFSVGTSILWVLLLFLWGFLLVILPFIAFCGVVAGLYWFVIMPEEDKEAIKSRDKNKKDHKTHSKEGGGISFLFTIAFLIVVFIDGNWLVTFGTLPFSYFVIAWLWGFMWTMIVLGIPVGVLGFIYFWLKVK